MANVFRIIFFFPIALLYSGILWVRHAFYNWEIYSIYNPSIPVISIGNLEFGGSGKTPMADYLIRHLQIKHKIAYLSRGYGRKKGGFILANETTKVQEIGDEAFQIYSKWKSNIALAVDANRTRGIREILRLRPETTLIILDDAMQHRKVKPKVSIQLTFYKKPFFRNFLFPAGSLRDLKARYTSADVLVFTKAPEATEESLQKMRESWNNQNLEPKPLFVSEIKYKSPVNQSGKPLNSHSAVVCIAGLASNGLFFDYCKNNFSVNQCISKPDHYRYLSDFYQRENLEEKTVLTTEKDFYKLLALAPDPEKLFYLPLEIGIYPEQAFLETIEKIL